MNWRANRRSLQRKWLFTRSRGGKPRCAGHFFEQRPHLPQNVWEWTGDPRGDWEGNTLVVDTTNFAGKTRFRGAGENLHLTQVQVVPLVATVFSA
jgi:hypothetical protein